MKRNDSSKTSGNGYASHSIRIEFSHPTATTIAIAGAFNNWRPDVTRMVALGGGLWRKELILPSGTHEYLLVVDGQWVPDPAAKETVANPFGGVNSVIRV